MRLALIRHGAACDTAGRCLGHTDVPLSREGLTAVQRLASAWQAEREPAVLAPPVRIIASDLARARASACQLAAGWELPFEVDHRLREADFGTWDGRTWLDIERDDGARLRTWMEDWVGTAPPGGESFSDLRRRTGCWYEELRATPGIAENETIAVVTHAGVIRALLCNLVDWRLSGVFDVRIDPACVTGVHCQGDRVELLFLNADRVPLVSPDPGRTSFRRSPLECN
jgi:alpha-ribazole phosphatase